MVLLVLPISSWEGYRVAPRAQTVLSGRVLRTQMTQNIMVVTHYSLYKELHQLRALKCQCIFRYESIVLCMPNKTVQVRFTDESPPDRRCVPQSRQHGCSGGFVQSVTRHAS